MKAYYGRENKSWYIKIPADRLTPGSIEEMHKALDTGIQEIKELKKVHTRIKKILNKFKYK